MYTTTRKTSSAKQLVTASDSVSVKQQRNTNYSVTCTQTQEKKTHNIHQTCHKSQTKRNNKKDRGIIKPVKIMLKK